MPDRTPRRLVDVVHPSATKPQISRLLLNQADADLFRRMCKATGREPDDVFREMLALFVEAHGLTPIYAESAAEP